MRLSSSARTPRFMSLKNALYLTRAPASRQIRANMRSVGAARFRTCVRVQRFVTPVVIGSDKSNLPKSNTRNKCGGTVRSAVVGACANTIPAFGPECVRRCAWREGGRPDSIEFFLTGGVKDGRSPILPTVSPLATLANPSLRRALSLVHFWP